jgi:hypothetical protein
MNQRYIQTTKEAGLNQINEGKHGTVTDDLPRNYAEDVRGLCVSRL